MRLRAASCAPRTMGWNDFNDPFRGRVYRNVAGYVKSLRAHGAEVLIARVLDAYGGIDERELAPFTEAHDPLRPALAFVRRSAPLLNHGVRSVLAFGVPRDPRRRAAAFLICLLRRPPACHYRYRYRPSYPERKRACRRCTKGRWPRPSRCGNPLRVDGAVGPVPAGGAGADRRSGLLAPGAWRPGAAAQPSVRAKAKARSRPRPARDMTRPVRLRARVAVHRAWPGCQDRRDRQ